MGQQITVALITFYMTPMMFVVALLRDLNRPLMVALSPSLLSSSR